MRLKAIVRALFILGIAGLILCGTVATVSASNVYDNRKGDGTPKQATADNVPCVTNSNDQKVMNGRGICVENLPTSVNNILWACDVHPTLGTGATLRGGIVPGSERCIDLTARNDMCGTVYVCAIGGTAATYIVHKLK